nr:transposase (putative), gypsy type [Tanacetum cinerariifolium]
MSFSKRPGIDVVCYTKPLGSLKGWNDHFLCVDTFACPALFPWHTGKSVSRDIVPKSSEFNAEHYATLVTYPAPFYKYPKPFLCLIGMSHNYSLDENTHRNFCTADPIKVRIVEREHDEDEPKILETIVGRVVPLLPVAPDRSSGKLKASVDKFFDEGGSGEQTDQGDSAGGGHGVPTVGGKSQSAVQRFLARAVKHAEVRGGVMPTFPFVSSSVSTTPEHSFDYSSVNIAEAEVDSVVRTFVPIMTNATTATPTADPTVIAKERLVGSSVFGGDSSSAGKSHRIAGGLSDCIGSDFLVGGIRTVVDPDSNLQIFYVPQWNVTNGFCMDDGGVCREMVDEEARQISLSAEVRMRAEYNIKEKRRLKSVVEEKDFLLKSRCGEIESLKAQLLIKEAKAAEAIRLRDEAQALREYNTNLEKEKSELEVKVTDLAALVKVREQEVADLDAVVTSVKLHNDSLSDQVHKLEASYAGLQEKVTVYENCMSQLEKFQDEKMKEVNEKFDKLCVDFIDMDLHLEEKFYSHLLTTIFERRWLLTHGMELAIAKCLNSIEYLSALGAAIGKAIDKGMQEGLSAGITHGMGLKTNKDASVEVIMNLLCLEDALAKKLGLVESQPHVDQLMVLIHHSPDQHFVGASALSLSLDVSSSQVRKIKENIANHVSALRGVFVPLSEPLSAMALEGTKCTSGAAPDTTTALFVTSISASTIPPISTDDYEIAHTKGREGDVADVEAVADEGVDPFPDVSGTKLDVLE